MPDSVRIESMQMCRIRFVFEDYFEVLNICGYFKGPKIVFIIERLHNKRTQLNTNPM